MDASVVVTALADDGPDGDDARVRLGGERLAAPHVIDLEVVSAWRRLAATGDLDARRVEFALADLMDLRLERVPHRRLLPRCWELRETLTTYDAAYVALAEALDCVMVTADRRMGGTASAHCEVEILG